MDRLADRLHRSGLRPFTPSLERAEVLAARTVGRDHLLDTIHRRLMSAATTGNRGHTLVVGARGSGKTHLVDVALHQVAADPVLRDRLAVARVDEDVVGIVGYGDLLLEVLAGLRPPQDVLDDARARRDPVAMEAAVTAQLQGRALVMVVENVAKVFENLGTSGQRHLRSFVETSGEVVLLATTPLLFKGIVSRSEPWFGSFAIEHLPDLTLDEGIELLRRLALEDGDEAFARFILSPRGRARLAALHHLAGGSPRLWMVLAGCASVELLDDLVPAVEELLESLVAYYQQRLWELPGNEQKLVRELGTGPASASVAELAARCGIDERTAATALGRLTESGWVRREKVPGTDQRRSWYRLREPLLRLHLQYRQAAGKQPLRLVVDILRAWFDPLDRRVQLAATRPESPAERHLLATLPLDPPQRSDAAYAGRDPDRLLGEARCWISQGDGLGSSDAGMLLEAAVLAATSSPEVGRAALDRREAPLAVRLVAEEVLSGLDPVPGREPGADRVGTALELVAAASVASPDHPVLELLAASWHGPSDPGRAVERLGALLDGPGDDRLTLTVRDEQAFWLGRIGFHDEAVAALSEVLDRRTRTLGPDHPDTLSTRRSLGDQLGEVGRHDEAVATLAAVVDDRRRVLGADHPDTLSARRSLGFHLVMAGRADEAVALAARGRRGRRGRRRPRQVQVPVRTGRWPCCRGRCSRSSRPVTGSRPSTATSPRRRPRCSRSCVSSRRLATARPRRRPASPPSSVPWSTS